MRPAFSVLFLTTLIGAGQGLFIALFFVELFAAASVTPGFFVGGSLLVLVLCGLGLIASFFHLGHPERAWRAAMMWRKGDRRRAMLMAMLAVIAASNVAIWTVPDASGEAPVGRTIK